MLLKSRTRFTCFWGSPKVRSRVSNSPYRLLGVDMRTGRGRRYRDIVDALVAEFGDANAIGLRELAGLKFTLELIQGDLVTGANPRAAEDLVRVSNLIARREQSMREDAQRRAPQQDPARDALEQYFAAKRLREQGDASCA